MSQGGSEGPRAFIDTLSVILRVMEFILKNYENKNDKEEVKKLKKDNDVAGAKKCGVFRRVVNEFYAKHFAGDWEDYENKETGQKYKIYKVKRDGKGIPILKEGSDLYNDSLDLITRAQENSTDTDMFAKNIQWECDTYINKTLFPKFKKALEETGDPELVSYADTLKDDSTVRDVFEGAIKKAKDFNGQIQEKDATQFINKEAAPGVGE